MAVLVLFFIVLSVVMAVLWRHANSQREDMEYRLLLGRNEFQGELENARNRTEMLHRMVDGIEHGLFIVDSDMRIAFMNRATRRFFPPVTEPVGRHLIECVRDHRIVEL